MKIDRDEARRVASQAHLDLDDAGLDRMAAEMTKILTYIDQLREIDVEGFEERDATEVGAILGIPAPTVRSRLSAAREQLQARSPWLATEEVK